MDKNQIELSDRIKIGFISLVSMFLLYIGIGQFASTQSHISLITDLDKVIPFHIDWIWIYLSYLPLLCITFLLASKENLFYSITIGLILNVMIASFFFAFFPSTYPRPLVECIDYTTCALYFTQKIDPPWNTFPSLHVALSWFIALSFKREGELKYRFFTTWAFLISLSTLFLKQHYLIDVFAAYALARFIRWIMIIVFFIKDYIDHSTNKFTP